MKKFAAVFVCLLLLSGCNGNESIDPAITLRNQIVSMKSCTFNCSITADYSDRIYTFQMTCSSDQSGNVTFTVLEPESISGISGRIDSHGGELIFDDQALFFPVLADGYLSPVSAPWILMKVLRSGYINGCSRTDDGYCITVDDSYEQKPMTVNIWTDNNIVPVSAEMIWEGRRVLSLNVTDFSCL